MKSRPVQYLGLILLVLVSLGVIFLPIGASPTTQPFQVRLKSPQPFSSLVGKGKNATDEAEAAIVKAFPSNETLPGTLLIGTDGQTATIEDKAATKAEAQSRSNRILKALATKFKGLAFAPDAAGGYSNLPSERLFPVSPDTSAYPPHMVNGRPVPAVKLGLDLQGGVELVLQIRRALFPYTIANAPTGDDARDALLARLRTALDATDANLGLRGVDVAFNPKIKDQLEVRTQATDETQFKAQTQAIGTALKSLQGVSATPARAPLFYQPQQSLGQRFGVTSDDYSKKILDRTIEILRHRVDGLGVSEPLIQKQGTDRIVVQLPGATDPQHAVDTVGQTAQLEIRLLAPGLQPVETEPGNVVFKDTKTGATLPAEAVKANLEYSKPVIEGGDVKPTTTAGFINGAKAAVFFELQGDGIKKFADATREAAARGGFIPIFLDEKCISAPSVEGAITGGSGQISGGFASLKEAQDLALLLNSGALPAPIDVVENRTVSATLGNDSLVKSLRAGAMGLAAVAVFMLAFYRLPGLLANCALVIYLILNIAVFVLLGGTLTLPGIAGFLLATAMSLDTNILVFERLKEEMAVLPSFHAALRAAFSRAWTAILDSHVTTLIASLVLFNFGTGPVKGFALTLGIGVMLSLFSAISVTRLFMWSVAGLGEKNRALFAGKLPAPETVIPHEKPDGDGTGTGTSTKVRTAKR